MLRCSSRQRKDVAVDLGGLVWCSRGGSRQALRETPQHLESRRLVWHGFAQEVSGLGTHASARVLCKCFGRAQGAAWCVVCGRSLASDTMIRAGEVHIGPGIRCPRVDLQPPFAAAQQLKQQLYLRRLDERARHRSADRLFSFCVTRPEITWRRRRSPAPCLASCRRCRAHDRVRRRHTRSC